MLRPGGDITPQNMPLLSLPCEGALGSDDGLKPVCRQVGGERAQVVARWWAVEAPGSCRGPLQKYCSQTVKKFAMTNTGDQM